MATAISKSDIVKQVANDTGSSIKDTEATVNATIDAIAQNLKGSDKVTFTGFGTFNAKNVPARQGRNPRTGEAIQISARREVRFSAGSDLKNKVNG